MDVQVMDYVAALKRGDLEAVNEISFDCIQCGLCASRCMGELPQYHMAQLARRLFSGKLVPRTVHLNEMVDNIMNDKYEGAVREVMKIEGDKLKKLYTDRQMEPAMSDESWKPDSDVGL